MFKYGGIRMQKKIPPQLACGSHVACLDCMFSGVQVTAGLGFFLMETALILHAENQNNQHKHI